MTGFSDGKIDTGLEGSGSFDKTNVKTRDLEG